MKFLCLCPTYGRRPEVLYTAIRCFLDQKDAEGTLMIYDDLGNFDFYGERKVLSEETAYGKIDHVCDYAKFDLGLYPGLDLLFLSSKTRCSGIIEKYNTMINFATQKSVEFDAVALWDDDDLYTYDHLATHRDVLESHEFSYPATVWSTYTGSPQVEPSQGRFWASSAIRYDSLSDVGGFVLTNHATFDQQAIAKWTRAFGVGRVTGGRPTYVFRWNDTQCNHSQHYMGDAENWYNLVKPSYTDQIIFNLNDIKLDISAQKTLTEIYNS